MVKILKGTPYAFDIDISAIDLVEKYKIGHPGEFIQLVPAMYVNPHAHEADHYIGSLQLDTGTHRISYCKDGSFFQVHTCDDPAIQKYLDNSLPFLEDKLSEFYNSNETSRLVSIIMDLASVFNVKMQDATQIRSDLHQILTETKDQSNLDDFIRIMQTPNGTLLDNSIIRQLLVKNPIIVTAATHPDSIHDNFNFFDFLKHLTSKGAMVYSLVNDSNNIPSHIAEILSNPAFVKTVGMVATPDDVLDTNGRFERLWVDYFGDPVPDYLKVYSKEL